MSIGGLKFPTTADVAAEEAERFRRSTAGDRMRAIRSALSAGALLIKRSTRREFLETYRQAQEELGREAISQFIARHAKHS